jgi:hypothetical protein
MSALWNEIATVFSTIFAVLKAIITLPFYAGSWISANMSEVMPSFLQWNINKTVALIIALVCTLLVAKYWLPVARGLGNALKDFWLIGGFLAIGIPVYMMYVLFSGGHAVATSGWLQASILLVACVALCLPGYRQWAVVALGRSKKEDDGNTK